jgi:hypothetical protein
VSDGENILKTKKAKVSLSRTFWCEEGEREKKRGLGEKTVIYAPPDIKRNLLSSVYKRALQTRQCKSNGRDAAGNSVCRPTEQW